jgi:asparagine synthase (glutamine-hydrolysing)
MCGICGKFTFSSAPVDSALITRMAATLRHRGPDEERVYSAPHIGLGQTRLSIIDLNKSATAPLANEDESIWVVFNGEIYNFQQLRQELQEKGHRFRTHCDTEVIAHLYEQYGFDCLQRMRGMFAFALWDSSRKLLFAARDRLGKKPFAYQLNGAALTFGSEIKAITADPSISISPNFEALHRYLSYQYVPSPLTAFEGIHRLPAGHFLTCDTQGDLRVQRYWSPPFAHTKMREDEREIERLLMEKLRESVRLRMISDVPLGAFLSGGIDSGAVVALMAESSDRPVKTFSIGFEDEKLNELPFARLVAQRYGTNHTECIVRADAADVLPKLVWHYNEPFADSSAIPTYYVSKVTREHVTVALSGDGGDESFSGYNRYGELLSWTRADMAPSQVKAMSMGLSAFLDRLPHHRYSARLSRGFYMAGADLQHRYALYMRYLKPQEQQAAYTPYFRNIANAMPHSYANPAAFPWQRDMDPLDWMMRHDQNFYLPDCLMVKTDVASMANSLEVRCPFLDHELVEFAAAIDSSRKRTNGSGKLILKSALASVLPPAILSKPKSGFGVPLGKWLRTELAGMLRECLLDDRALRRGLFQPKFIRTLLDEHFSGKRDWSARLWAFLFLELWFRQFID